MLGRNVAAAASATCAHGFACCHATVASWCPSALPLAHELPPPSPFAVSLSLSSARERAQYVAHPSSACRPTIETASFPHQETSSAMAEAGAKEADEVTLVSQVRHVRLPLRWPPPPTQAACLSVPALLAPRRARRRCDTRAAARRVQRVQSLPRPPLQLPRRCVLRLAAPRLRAASSPVLCPPRAGGREVHRAQARGADVGARQGAD